MAKNKRLAKTDKIARRLRGIKSGVGINLSKAVHTVNIVAESVPVTLPGFLVSIDSHGVVFRHKKTNASKKTRITTFPRNEVVKVLGAPGEVSSITVMRPSLIETLIGYVERDPKTGVIVVTDVTTGETTTVMPHSGVQVEVFADEDEKVQRKGKGKAAKPGKKKSRPEPEEEEDFEEEDEDLEEDEDDEDLDEDMDEEEFDDEDDEDSDEDDDDLEEDEDDEEDDDDLEEDEDEDEDEDEL